MARLLMDLIPESTYWDKKNATSALEWREKLKISTCVYVGNLNFSTTEEILYEWFSKCGDISTLVLGRNGLTRQGAAGFAFIRYKEHFQARRAVNQLNGVCIDRHNIRVDWDTGDNILEPSRRFGRGTDGRQWRDMFRDDFNAGRGGAGGGLDFAAEAARLQTESKRKRFRETY